MWLKGKKCQYYAQVVKRKTFQHYKQVVKSLKCQHYTQECKRLKIQIFYTCGEKVKNANIIHKWLKG